MKRRNAPRPNPDRLALERVGRFVDRLPAVIPGIAHVIDMSGWPDPLPEPPRPAARQGKPIRRVFPPCVLGRAKPGLRSVRRPTFRATPGDDDIPF